MLTDDLCPNSQFDDLDQFSLLHGVGEWQQVDAQGEISGFEPSSGLFAFDLIPPTGTQSVIGTGSVSRLVPNDSNSNIDGNNWLSPHEESAPPPADRVSDLHDAPQVSEVGERTSSSIISRHTRNRCYECTVCGWACRSSQALENHAKKTFHRVYHCPWTDCGKTFHRRDTFVRHKTLHERPCTFSCWVCALMGQRRVFNRKDHLTQHFRKSHPNLSLEYPVGIPKPEILASRTGSPAPSVSDQTKTQGSSYSKRDISDLENALSRFFAPDDICLMNERLDLHNSSKEQVRKRLRSLILEQPAHCCPHSAEFVA